MDRLIDYVRWVGDLSFEQKPFCEMDVLILCVVGYLDMKPVYAVEGMGTPDVKNEGITEENLIPKVEKTTRMTIHDISERIRAQGLTYYVRTVGPDNGQIELQDAIAASKRFGDVIVKDYVDEFDPDTALQFSAMTFEAAGKRIVSYCGTDHTIAGWKEDFMISFTHVLAQNKAVQYAHKAIAKEPECPFILSGHSKGGNLALYAACMLNDEDWEKVEHVYDLDGPGLCEDVVDLSVLDRIQDKTTLVGPEYAVISKLFKVDLKDSRIIRSDAEGIMQHGLYTWCTDHGEMDLAEANDPRSLALNMAIDQWMKDLSTDDRKHFIDQLFDSLSAGGKAVTLDDIGKKGGPRYEEVMVKMLAMDEQTKRIFMELPVRTMIEKDVQLSIETTIDKAKKQGPVEWLLKNEAAQGGALILGGLLVALMAGFIVDLVVIFPMIIMVGVMIGLTYKKLSENNWNFEEERLRVSVTIMATGALLVMILKEGATEILGSMAIGILLLIFSYSTFVHYQQREKDSKDSFGKVLQILEIVFGAVVGICMLMISGSMIEISALIIGGALVVDGILHIVHGRRTDCF